MKQVISCTNNFVNRLSILFTRFSGTLTDYWFGNITAGFLPGAIYSEVIYFPNPHPDKCSTNTGVTYMKSSIAVITIKKGDKEITCWGKYKIRWNPGLTYD